MLNDTRNVYDVLTERGLLKQSTHPEEIYKLLGEGSVTFYTGFDPTADSLHIGHYIPLITMAHMQHAGHRPIALLGGATAMIGDPTDKTEMRSMLDLSSVADNAERFKTQMSRLIDFSDGRALMVNNADWINSLNFLDFVREIGIHFSVNRMLSAECYKQRMETGLTFFEMSYMLMQSYDFLVLHRKYDCVLEMGGDDQWSNMLGGMELIRKMEGESAYCLTNPLLLKSDGKKMGKTESGALWLDKEKTSVYDFYQYWRNVDDADVKRCLKMLTFLPIDEINELCAAEGAALNEAKRMLAYTVTAQIHGEEEAQKARDAAQALFAGGGDLSNMPTLELSQSDVDETGLRVVDIMALGGLCKSKSDARRMIESGACMVDNVKIDNVAAQLEIEKLEEGVVLKKGKKNYLRVLIAEG